MRFNKVLIVFIVAITLLAGFLRFYDLTKPHPFYIDEAAIGWNAYSILKTGRDEYGKLLPLSFESFGDFKLPGYIYVTAGNMALFGKTEFAVRAPAAFFGTLTVLVFILLVAELTRSKRLSLLSGLLLAISPWHLHFTRAGFESALALFFIVLGTYLVILDFYKRAPLFFLGILSFILSLYTYHTPRIVTPLLLVSLLVIFKGQLKRIMSLPLSKMWLIALVFITVPFALYAVSPDGLARAGAVSNPAETIKNLGFNYFAHFSLDFLFFTGDTVGRHSVREIGELYIWQLPFLLIGLYTSLKARTKTSILFLIWLIASPLAAALSNPVPHALRALPMVIPLTYFVALGITSLARNNMAKVTVAIATVYFFLSYLHIYYVHYPNRTSPDWDNGYVRVIQYISEHANQYEQVAITNSFNNGYVYLYFYGDFDPREVQLNESRKNGYGKFFYQSNNFPLPTQKTLYISQFHDAWEGTKIGQIKNQSGDPQYLIWEN